MTTRSRVLSIIALVTTSLSLAVMLVGCSLDLGRKTTTTTASSTTMLQASTTTLPAVAGGALTAQYLFTEYDPIQGTRIGGTGDFTVTIDPATSKKVSVGIQESEVSGAGAQTRASVWGSCLAATSLLNLNIADFRFNYDVGFVDGPSAGGIYTAAALAVLLGDDFRPDAIMTGAINPDFSIGPVGGIPLKLEGAAEAGKRLVLVPMGQRFDFDSRTREWVDVVEKGRTLGMEVREVADIYQAYRLLTGKALPQPTPAPEEPELSQVAYGAVLAQADSWLTLTRQRLEAYTELPDEYKSDYEEGRASRAESTIDRANKYLSQGLLGPGYFTSLMSAFHATVAYNYVETEQIIKDQGDLAAADVLAQSKIHDALADTKDRLLATEPQNVSQALALMQAWGHWTAASGLVDDADRELTNMSTEPDAGSERLDAIYLAVYNFTRAYQALWAANDALALGDTLEGSPIRSTEALDQLAEAYRLAANANLETIRALVVLPMAKEEGITEDQAEAVLAYQDGNYAEASAIASYYRYLDKVLPEGPQRDYAVLGAALTSFADSAASLADHYSYQAERDADGYITGFTNEKALAASLDFSRGRARAMIAEVAEGGNDVALPILYYQNAGVEREGDAENKLSALSDYWTAGLYARVAGILSQTLKPLAPRR